MGPERLGGGTAPSGVPGAAPPADDATGGGRIRVQVELATRVPDVTPLRPVAASLAGVGEIQTVLDDVLATVAAVVHADGALLLLAGADGDLFVQAARGAAVEGLAVAPHRWNDTVAGRTMRSGAPVSVVGPALEGWARDAGVRGVHAVPLQTLGGEVTGALLACFTQGRGLAATERHLVAAYGRQAAEMIGRVRLHSEANELAALERRHAAQLRGLADAALEISAETDVGELLRLVTEAAQDIVGSHQAVTTLVVRGDRASNAFVCLSEEVGEWRDAGCVPAGLGRPNAVTRENKPMRLTADQLAADRVWCPLVDAPGAPVPPGYLGAPLIGSDDRNAGLIELTHKVDATDFTAEDEAILVQLAQMASVAIENAELLARERTARREAEEGSRLQALLSDASHAFAASLHLADTLDTLARLTVPALADWSAVHLLGDDGTTAELAVVAAVDDAVAARMRAIEAERPRTMSEPDGPGATIRTGQTQHDPGIPDEVEAHVAEGVPSAEARAAAPGTAVVVPLPARGRTIGSLTMTRDGGPSYTTAEVAFAEDLARRAALAIDNARRYAFERGVAGTLQHTLLPHALPHAGTLTAAARYVPGGAGAQVGGDWYDLVDLGRGRFGVVVGDVMGRGIGAAAIMGQLRAVVRAFALDGHRPGRLLERLDRVVRGLDEAQLTTAAYGVIDTGTLELTISLAGHLPPLIVPPDGEASFPSLVPGLPLGVGGGDFPETTLALRPGSTLVLYTDGLVESAEEPIDEGMERLRLAAAPPVRSPEDLCDRLMQTLGRQEHADDTAVLAVTLRELASADAPVCLALRPDASAAGTARRFVAEVLMGRWLDDLVDTAGLLTSEIVTNAVRHAGEPREVRIAVGPRSVRIDVSDTAAALPTAGDLPDGETESGRGMAVVEALAHRWGCERLQHGKRVWFELVVDRG